MSLNKLTKQLKREIAGSPKKAAVLGLLALVAVYFWMPLVWGWISAEDAEAIAEQPASAPEKLAVPENFAGVEAPPKPEQAVKYNWRELATWIDNDPTTLPASALSGQRDPFSWAETAQVVEPTRTEGDEEERLAEKEITPADLGMVLSSTIIGPRRKVARIDGKSYYQGQDITLVKDGREISFRLAGVYPRKVVVERNGHQFELKTASTDSSGTIEMYSGTN